MNRAPQCAGGSPRARLCGLVLCLLACVIPASARSKPLAHFYAVNEPSSWDSLRANAAHIELLSPRWFVLGPQLELESSVDAQVVDWARKHRLRLMPLLTNSDFEASIVHSLLQDEDQRKKLAAGLAQVCADNGFWGMQLDLENVPADDRDAYTAFARDLAGALRRRKCKLSIAVPAPLQPAAAPAPATQWIPSPVAAGFDYRELGKIADFVSLMAYDEHVTEPGPIAGLPWVEACLKAVLPMVPAKKLSLGAALYYRRWERQSSGKYSVTEGAYGDALQLAVQQSSRPQWDADQQELRAAGPDTGGTVMWISSADSLRQRIELAKRYRLQGFSAWRLGQEDPAVWEVLARAGR